MFEYNFIRKVIKKYADSGIHRFIVYPFGVNGVNIRNCLSDCFGMKPEMIIDNEHAKYNIEIKSFETLKQYFDENMYIILSAEDRMQNKEMQKEIRKFVPQENLINLLQIKEGINREISNQFSIDNFLPGVTNIFHRNLGKKDNEKIKIRILHTVYAFWNSIDSVCTAFMNDSTYEVQIILGNHEEDCERRKRQMEKKGYSYIVWNDYDAKEDTPDILILTHLWDRTVLANCREYTKLIIVASMSLIRYGYSNSDFINLVQMGHVRFYPDYYLFDSLIYSEIKDEIFFRGKVAEIGNAKFDGIFRACEEKKYPVGWEKLKGKKNILWASDHGIEKQGMVNLIKDEVTFDLYAKVFFQYAQKNQDVGLIFRPHPAFIYEMTELGYWSKSDLALLRKYCEKSKNIVFDETETYNAAYSVADAIVADALCGITCSALPTLKPICVLYRTDKEVEAFAGELVKNYYAVRSEEELKAFFEMIRENRDPMYELRKAASEKYIKHFDGKNGLRIKKFIEEKYEKVNQRVIK